ncbi:MAG TPA: HK97 gp10 family phage protein [Devosia sp.]|jgi:hypothetical protein|nr:HK97 gp10 family phage protein [Devosia sp.]
MAARSKMTGAKAMATTFRRASGGLLTPISAAARKSLAPQLAAAKRNSPRDDGDLRKSLIIKKNPKSPKTKPQHVVGPRADYVGKDGAQPVRYAHLTEFGSADGSQAGTRWLTASFEETADEVMKRLKDGIGTEIEKHLAKKAGRK